jgi:hypothetical protein
MWRGRRDRRPLFFAKPVARPDFGKLRHRRVPIIRDYGMTDRNEAPQFYPEARRPGQGVAAE